MNLTNHWTNINVLQYLKNFKIFFMKVFRRYLLLYGHLLRHHLKSPVMHFIQFIQLIINANTCWIKILILERESEFLLFLLFDLRPVIYFFPVFVTIDSIHSWMIVITMQKVFEETGLMSNNGWIYLKIKQLRARSSIL